VVRWLDGGLVSPGAQGLHLRRRSGRLAVTFRSRVVETVHARPSLRIETADQHLVLHGTLSSGSLDWILSARASCYRRTITVEITAVRGPARPVAGVEDHEYEATLEGAGSGRYRLRVNHVWLLNADPGEMLVMPAYEGTITL